MNTLITTNKIESVKKKKSYKVPGPDGFTVKTDQTCKEQLTLILLKLILKTEEEGTRSKTFCGATNTKIRKKTPPIKKI